MRMDPIWYLLKMVFKKTDDDTNISLSLSLCCFSGNYGIFKFVVWSTKLVVYPQISTENPEIKLYRGKWVKKSFRKVQT